MKPRSSRNLSTYLLSVLTGALYGFAFPPYNVSFLGWLALAPLVLALKRAGSWRCALLHGAVSAAVMCFIGYGWIASTAHRFWPVPWPVAILCLLAFSTFGEINFTLFAVLFWKLRRKLEKLPAAVTAALFVAVEFVVPKIFPDALAHTQVTTPALPSATSLIGLSGLSFIVGWLGVCVAWYPSQTAISRRRRRLELLVCLLSIAGLWGYGAHRQAALQAMPNEHELELVIVQTNIGDPVGYADELGSIPLMVDSVVALYEQLTRKAMRNGPADFVLWPETAVPASPRDIVFERIATLVQEIDAPLIFGGYDFEPIPDTQRWRIYNTLFWMDRTGRIRDHYYKHKLIPLGEYVPFSESFPILMDLLPTPGEFTRGPGARVMQIEGITFAPLICYELLFPRYVRRGIRMGGQVLLNLTNDYWFGGSTEPEQHLALARMRAFEYERPIIRATNTGITALIDARGRMIARTALWQPEILRATLPVPEMHSTPYARWGEGLTVVAILLACGVVGLLWKLFP